MSNRVKMTGPSDAARRVSDTYQLHRSAAPYDSIGKWFAVTLHDGSSDGVLYDTKQSCVRYQKHMEMFYAFIQVTPAHMSAQDADIFLNVHRRMYEKGLRMADPESPSGGRDIIKRATKHDQNTQTRSILIGDRPPSNIILPKE